MINVTNCLPPDIMHHWHAAQNAGVDIIITAAFDMRRHRIPHMAGIYVQSESDRKRFWRSYHQLGAVCSAPLG
jgi:hypothetical protein